MGWFSVQLLFLVAAVCHSALAGVLEINPKNAVVNSTVTITCKLDSTEASARRVSLFKLFKGVSDIYGVVSYSDGQIAVKKGLGHPNVLIDGAIKDPASSYMTLTFNASLSDAGDYTCQTLYLSKSGKRKADKTVRTLVVEEPGSTTLYPDIQELKELIFHINKEITDAQNKEKKILDLAKDVATVQNKHANKLTDILNSNYQSHTLKTRIETTGMVVDDFINKVSFRSAFIANNPRDVKPTNGKAIFSDMILNEGNDYDPATGQYTAPRKGIYVFHLTVTMACKSCWIVTGLMKNDKMEMSMTTGDQEFWDQSTTSGVLQLDYGDTVHIGVSHPAMIHYTRMTEFSGYFLKDLDDQEELM